MYGTFPPSSNLSRTAYDVAGLINLGLERETNKGLVSGVPRVALVLPSPNFEQVSVANFVEIELSNLCNAVAFGFIFVDSCLDSVKHLVSHEELLGSSKIGLPCLCHSYQSF